MKLRAGFVSNSSSSSFTAVGFLIDRDKTQALIEKVYEPEVLNEVAEEQFKKPWAELDEVERNEVYYDLKDSTDICIMDNEEEGAPEDKAFIGRKIEEHDDNEGATEESQTKISDLVAEFSTFCEVAPDIFKIEDLTIMVGSRMS